MSKKHVIDGVTYVEVNRKAEVGDKVIIIGNASHHPFRDCEVVDVERTVYDLGGILAYSDDCTGDWGIIHEDYNVLELLESEEVMVDGTQASEQVIEMFAALSRKIVSLERQLADTQRNLETFAEQTENNSEDIRTLDERTQVINAITKFYEEGRR